MPFTIYTPDIALGKVAEVIEVLFLKKMNSRTVFLIIIFWSFFQLPLALQISLRSDTTSDLNLGLKHSEELQQSSKEELHKMSAGASHYEKWHLRVSLEILHNVKAHSTM